METLYNENEPFAADWLVNLERAGHIAGGQVDRRSIVELEPDDVRGAVQFHAFAGLGGWSYALRLAGWPDDAPVWTGSCPCQPFSAAGKRGGFADERHLWPAWFRLIRECRPAVIFGEQVAGRDGAKWLDVVFADLEGVGYACAAADLCAAGVGAPHLRQRLYFVADRDQARRGLVGLSQLRGDGHAPRRHDADGRGAAGLVADAHEGAGRQGRANGGGGERRAARREPHELEPSGIVGVAASERRARGGTQSAHGEPLQTNPWADPEWLDCLDGKRRPTQPGLHPLAHGVSGRVGRLRAYGNAIVPQTAAAFVRAWIEARG